MRLRAMKKKEPSIFSGDIWWYIIIIIKLLLLLLYIYIVAHVICSLWKLWLFHPVYTRDCRRQGVIRRHPGRRMSSDEDPKNPMGTMGTRA